MEQKSVIKKMIVFMLIMGMIALVFMFMNTILADRNKTYIDINSMELVQLEEPKDGDTIAVIDTSLGEIKAVLYPEYSPNAVKNFTELAEQGYYDGTFVFHSEAGAYSAAGAKLKDGTMPEGYEQERELIERELHQNLWPFRGALCMLNTTAQGGVWDRIMGDLTYYNGSRFALVNTIEFDEELTEELIESSESEALANAFIEKGGVPNFSQQMTVIGQAYEGLDVIEKLASLETAEVDNTPVEDVMINSIKIEKYTSKNAQKK